MALDPYSSDGHDGIVSDDGVIMNDETVEFLCRQAVSQVNMQHCRIALDLHLPRIARIDQQDEFTGDWKAARRFAVAVRQPSDGVTPNVICTQGDPLRQEQRRQAGAGAGVIYQTLMSAIRDTPSEMLAHRHP